MASLPIFNFYEVRSPDVLRSPPYLARLNDPTPWTKDVVATFIDTSRTICRVACSAGTGIGAFAVALCFDVHEEAQHESMMALVNSLPASQGIVGAHLLTSAQDAAIETSESRLRGQADIVWSAVLIVEAAALQALRSLKETALTDASLERAGFAQPKARGLYQLEYCLDRTESERVESSS